MDGGFMLIIVYGINFALAFFFLPLLSLSLLLFCLCVLCREIHFYLSPPFTYQIQDKLHWKRGEKKKREYENIPTRQESSAQPLGGGIDICTVYTSLGIWKIHVAVLQINTFITSSFVSPF